MIESFIIFLISLVLKIAFGLMGFDGIVANVLLWVTVATGVIFGIIVIATIVGRIRRNK